MPWGGELRWRARAVGIRVVRESRARDRLPREGWRVACRRGHAKRTPTSRSGLLPTSKKGRFFKFGLLAHFLHTNKIRRLRHQQEADLVQRIFTTLNSQEFAAALSFVYNDLAALLADKAYVRETADGKATAASHREFVVMHFFNGWAC